MAQLIRNIGNELKKLREAAGRRQEDVAVAARQLGFTWSRSTVAMLEGGRYELKAAELLALPRILRGAGVGDVSLPALLAADEEVALTHMLAIAPAELAKLAGKGARASNVAYTVIKPATIVNIRSDLVEVTFADTSDADEKMARNLGVDISTFLEEARSLWGRNLAAERDARVAETAPPAASNRTMQALRAHTTRALKAEIRPRIEKFQDEEKD